MDDLARYIALLGKPVAVTVDRPLGSPHPTHGFTYQTNYGFVPDTQAGDGHEIDAYILGVDEPLTRFEGICIAVIMRFDDDEHKLVVAPAAMPRHDVVAQTRFVEGYYDTQYILVEGDEEG